MIHMILWMHGNANLMTLWNLFNDGDRHNNWLQNFGDCSVFGLWQSKMGMVDPFLFVVRLQRFCDFLILRHIHVISKHAGWIQNLGMCHTNSSFWHLTHGFMMIYHDLPIFWQFVSLLCVAGVLFSLVFSLVLAGVFSQSDTPLWSRFNAWKSPIFNGN